MNSNAKIEKILSSSSADGKDFKTLLANLQILDKNETSSLTSEPKKNLDYTNKFMRYKRDPHKGSSMESDPNKENPLKTSTRQLLTGEITGEQYRNILRDNKINPNAEAINKIIRQHESGNQTRFDELYFAINKFPTDLDPTKIQITSKFPEFNGETRPEQEKINKSIIPDKNGNGIVCLAQKRPVKTKYSYHDSNKDLFDWEISILNKYKSGEFRRSENDRNDPRTKIVYESNVFSSDVHGDAKENKKKSFNATSNHFQGSGDFLTWKGDVKSTAYSEKKEIKRKNPNEVKNEVPQEKPTRKMNTMQIPSRENVLITNSLAVI